MCRKQAMDRDRTRKHVGLMKGFVQGIGAVLAAGAFACIGPAMASAVAGDMESARPVWPRQFVVRSPLCAACRQGPSLKDPGSDDRPVRAVARSWLRLGDEPCAPLQQMLGDALNPPVEFRIWYCRWLN